MTDFKLIAILPLLGCSNKFSKNLATGQSYQFYQQYKIQFNQHKSKVIYIDVDTKIAVPKNFYRLKNEISINFSAVVGKNGSGKSTLIELLYRAIYMMGTREKHYGVHILKRAHDDLQEELMRQQKDLMILLTEENIDFSAYDVDPTISSPKTKPHDLDLFILDLIRTHKLEVKYYEADSMKGIRRKVAARLNSKIADTRREIKEEKVKEALLDSRFNVSVIYETEGVIKEMHCKNGRVKHYQIFSEDSNKPKAMIDDFSLDNFFYSISLNYSHHGLNANTLGKWINKLFHKNDAYRTPVVINPMRHNGNFDINDETKLSIERLMSTLVYDLLNKKNNLLINKYKVSSFIFTRKLTSQEPVGTELDFENLAYSRIIKHFGIKYHASEIANGEAALNYLANKIGKVAESYKFLFNNKEGEEKAFENFIKSETSHITKKIRQTVNYLKLPKEKVNKTWKNAGDDNPINVTLTPDELEEYVKSFELETNELGPEKLIEYALPGFFNIDFEFVDTDGEILKLSEMSSGEQQIIFNANAILYHLYNIQSACSEREKEDSSKPNISNRPVYKFVNIILDEMELYYHPEMQRQFVAELINSFNKLNIKSSIKAINVCILTHSPFILSDIPLQNTLRLVESGQLANPEKHQTFAANIHDILRRGFLLEDGFMGKFAHNKIDRVIDSLKIHSLFREEKKTNKDFSEKDKRSLLINNETFKDFNIDDLLSETECKDCISLIGEPVLYESIMELYAHAFPEKKKSFFEQQVAILERLSKI